MRIRLIQKPRHGCIDGVDVDRFQVGTTYDVGSAVATVFLAEHWAVPVMVDEPATVIPLSQLPPRGTTPRVRPKTSNDARRKRSRRASN